MSTPKTVLSQAQQTRILAGLRHFDSDTIRAYAQEQITNRAERQRIEAHLFDCEECLTNFNVAFDAHSPRKADFDVFQTNLAAPPMEETISEWVHLLLDAPDTSLRQQAIVELRPAAAAGNTQAINALKYTALETWDNQVVREKAAEALTDLQIPLQREAGQERLSLLESLLGLFGGAKRLAMGFASSDDRQSLNWASGQIGSIYRQEGALALQLVLKQGTTGALAIVFFQGVEAEIILKPGIIRQSREGVLFADVPLDGIGKEGVIAPPYIVGEDDLALRTVHALLTAAYAQATEADRIIWKQWAESLAAVPPELTGLVAQMKSL